MHSLGRNDDLKRYYLKNIVKTRQTPCCGGLLCGQSSELTLIITRCHLCLRLNLIVALRNCVLKQPIATILSNTFTPVWQNGFTRIKKHCICKYHSISY